MALTQKSTKGAVAAQSCEGCAAVWMTTATFAAYLLKRSVIAPWSRMSMSIMVIAFEFGFEPPPTPNRTRLRSKKFAAHIIVDANNIKPLRGKQPRSLGAYQASRACNYGNSHPAALLIVEAELLWRNH